MYIWYIRSTKQASSSLVLHKCRRRTCSAKQSLWAQIFVMQTHTDPCRHADDAVHHQLPVISLLLSYRRILFAHTLSPPKRPSKATIYVLLPLRCSCLQVPVPQWYNRLVKPHLQTGQTGCGGLLSRQECISLACQSQESITGRKDQVQTKLIWRNLYLLCQLMGKLLHPVLQTPKEVNMSLIMLSMSVYRTQLMLLKARKALVKITSSIFASGFQFGKNPLIMEPWNKKFTINPGL